MFLRSITMTPCDTPARVRRLCEQQLRLHVSSAWVDYMQVLTWMKCCQAAVRLDGAVLVGKPRFRTVKLKQLGQAFLICCASVR